MPRKATTPDVLPVPLVVGDHSAKARAGRPRIPSTMSVTIAGALHLALVARHERQDVTLVVAIARHCLGGFLSRDLLDRRCLPNTEPMIGTIWSSRNARVR
jgi:hypothetical protein